MGLAAGLVLGSSLSGMAPPQQEKPTPVQAEAQQLPRQMLAMLERDAGQLRAFIDANFAEVGGRRAA